MPQQELPGELVLHGDWTIGSSRFEPNVDIVEEDVELNITSVDDLEASLDKISNEVFVAIFRKLLEDHVVYSIKISELKKVRLEMVIFDHSTLSGAIEAALCDKYGAGNVRNGSFFNVKFYAKVGVVGTDA